MAASAARPSVASRSHAAPDRTRSKQSNSEQPRVKTLLLASAAVFAGLPAYAQQAPMPPASNTVDLGASS